MNHMNPPPPLQPAPTLPTTAALIGSLGSTLCPTCEGHKQPTLTVCGRCYGRLGDATRKALYRRVGNGYEEAVLRAMRELKVETFHVPPAFAPRATEKPAIVPTSVPPRS